MSHNGALDDVRRLALDVARRRIDDDFRGVRALGLSAADVRSIADGALARIYPEDHR